MSKTIWLISKYNYPPDENSFGNRGWNLMKNFASKGFKSIVITSDSTPYKNIPKLSILPYSSIGINMPKIVCINAIIINQNLVFIILFIV